MKGKPTSGNFSEIRPFELHCTALNSVAACTVWLVVLELWGTPMAVLVGWAVAVAALGAIASLFSGEDIRV